MFDFFKKTIAVKENNASKKDEKPSVQKALGALWKPFTANRDFKSGPRIVTKGEGMYYTDIHGNKILDAVAGLWCLNLGNCHPAVSKAIAEQASTLYYSTAFQLGNTLEFELAQKWWTLHPLILPKYFLPTPDQKQWKVP